MTNKNDSALRDKLQALRLAEIQATDAEDMELCVRDMQSFANLSEGQARVVAAAVRSKHLPSLARQAGLDETVVAQLDASREHALPMKTDSFAKEKPTHDDPMAGGDDHDSEGLHDDFGGGDGGADLGDEDGMPSDDLGDATHSDEAHDHSSAMPEPSDDPDMDGDMGGAMPFKNESHGPDSGQDDLSEGKDVPNGTPGDIATIQIEVPANKLDDSKMQQMQHLLEKLFGGDGADDSAGSDDPDMGDKDGGITSDSSSPLDGPSDSEPFPGGDPEMGGGMGDSTSGETPTKSHKPPFGGGKSDSAEDAMSGPHTASRKVNTMTKEAAALAARAAERKAILAQSHGTRTASEENGTKPRDIGLGRDTSEGTYGGEKPSSPQFADAAQYHGEDKFPTMTMQNSEGNSLKDQNPTFNKTRVPTLNPDNLQLGDSYEIEKKEGSPDGSLDYTVDFAKVDFIPSSDPSRDGNFKLPTQIDEMAKRKTTVAKIVECQGCNNPRHAEVNSADCQDCGTRVAICQVCENEGHCPVCAATVTASAEKDADTTNVTVNADDEIDEGKTDDGETKREKGRFDGSEMPQKDRDTDKQFGKEAQVFRARLKTAYSVSSRLALAGLLHPSEVDGNVDMWMDGGLTAKTMLTQGSIMLRSASSATERVTAAAAEKMNVRTASSQIGLSTNPAFSGSTGNSAPLDLQQALKGLFSMPKIED